MSNPTTEAEIRDEIAKLEAADARLEGQLADLEQRRAEVEAERRKNARRAEAHRDDLREILNEPETKRQLNRATSALRARLERQAEYPGDQRSPTRQRVRLTLEALEGDSRTTTRDKLHRVQELARDFSDRRQLDSQHYANSERR